mgnify:CR=1 FL=1
MEGQPFDATAHYCQDRVFQNRGINTSPRWTGRSLVFSPGPRGVYNVPRRLHEISRTVSPRSSEARTAPTVFYHEPRTPRDSHPVHDPVSRSLPPTLRGCLRTPHSGYLPRRPTGASTDDPRINQLLPTNNRVGDFPCPRNRSDTSQHRLFDGVAPKHSPSPGGKPIPTGPPMHDLFWLWPLGHRVPSPPQLPNLSFPGTHAQPNHYQPRPVD